jgi:hypothetical protein
MFGYSLLRPGLNQAFFQDVFNECRKFDVDIEGWHTETGKQRQNLRGFFLLVLIWPMGKPVNPG